MYETTASSGETHPRQLGQPVGEISYDFESGSSISSCFVSTRSGTRGADPGTSYRTNELLPASRSQRKTTSDNHLDGSLLRKVQELLDSMDVSDEMASALVLDSLAGAVVELWDSAAQSGEVIQDILAILENGVRSCALDGAATLQQVDAFKEAASSLALPRPIRTHTESLRDTFSEAGVGALAFLDDVDKPNGHLELFEKIAPPLPTHLRPVLSEEQLKILQLRFIDGKTHSEIGEMTGRNVEATKVLVSKIFREIRSQLRNIDG